MNSYSANSFRQHQLPDDGLDVVDAPVMSVANFMTDQEQHTTIDDLETYASEQEHIISYSGNSRNHNKSLWLAMIMMTLVVMTMCGVVGMTIVRNQRDERQDDPTSLYPRGQDDGFLEPFASLEEYYGYVLDVVAMSNKDEDAVVVTNMIHWTDISKPQYDAIQHLVYQDAANGLVVQERQAIEQRLALLLLYFHTGGQKQTWANNKWIQSATPECQWEHVGCTQEVDMTTRNGNITSLQVVTHLRLKSQASMTNTLPVETFHWLPHLRLLDVSTNRLSGEIPWTLWRLSNLEFLSLSKNQFEGQLPRDLRGMERLQDLHLSDNWLTGQLPLHLPLHSLESFLVDTNQLTGSIPESWWHENMAREDSSTTTRSHYPLWMLSLKYNMGLTGTMPSQIGLLSSLKDLSVKRCDMEGSIPTQVGLLSKMETFSIADNRFSGKFPFAEMLKLPRLEGLTLGENNLSGSIPGDVLQNYTAKFQRLVQWNMPYNAISGTLPTELGLVTSLQWIQFNNNHIHGGFPTAAMEATKMYQTVRILWLNGNNLEGTMPCGNDSFHRTVPGDNCGKDWRSDCSAKPDVTCECCNMCF
jgi:hypothetical protein